MNNINYVPRMTPHQRRSAAADLARDERARYDAWVRDSSLALEAEHLLQTLAAGVVEAAYAAILANAVENGEVTVHRAAHIWEWIFRYETNPYGLVDYEAWWHSTRWTGASGFSPEDARDWWFARGWSPVYRDSGRLSRLYAQTWENRVPHPTE